MSNRPFPTPPLQVNIVSQISPLKLNELWAQWIDYLHLRLSSRNHQKIISAQPLSVDSNYASLTTTSTGYSITLEPPTIPGIYKIIEMIARGGSNNVTMSLTNVVIAGSTPTTATWNSVGDTLVLVSRSNKWQIIDNYGVTLT